MPGVEESRPIPARVLWISGLALAIPVLAAGLGPVDMAEGAGVLTWIMALVPILLLTWYRGWPGGLLGLVGGVAALVGSQLVLVWRGGEPPSALVLAPLIAGLVLAAVGAGVVGRPVRDGLKNRATLTDPETGIPGRAHLEIVLDTALASADLSDGSVACILLDAPDLDRLAVGRGDDARKVVLEAIVALGIDASKGTGVFGRWDEVSFLLVLPNRSRQAALALASRLRASFDDLDLRWKPLRLRTRVVVAGDPGAGRAPLERALTAAAVEPPEPDTGAGTSSEQASEPLDAKDAAVATSPWRSRALGGRILAVDDEPANLRALRRSLSASGFRDLQSAEGGAEAIARLKEELPDLLILDLHMPGVDGFDVLESLSGIVREGEFFPVLVVTGDQHWEQRQKALRMGAKDFLTKPFDVTELGARALNLIETRLLHRRLRDANLHLEERVRARTLELQKAQDEVLFRLGQAVEYRDDITGRHAQRVGEAAAIVASSLGLSVEDQRTLRRAAPLHDIGKIAIPDSILLKPGPLTSEEVGVMKAHTTIGADLLANSTSRAMEHAREIALSHHEHWDGGGYPRGLRGDAIPLSGRIVGLVDALDVLVHVRPYKAAITFDAALARIRTDSGTHFDPALVAALEAVLPDLRELMRQADPPGRRSE